MIYVVIAAVIGGFLAWFAFEYWLQKTVEKADLNPKAELSYKLPGKIKPGKPAKRPNRNHISKRVRYKHRKARKRMR
jgi:hypothetical protein